MKESPTSAISPRREENYPEWYQEVIKAADLAEHSPVRGCMVIKPWGYSLWENIQRIIDRKFKESGVQNAYFPLFIPLSFLEKEAAHVEGFAKECAVVTHHRLEKNVDGKLVPTSPLEEPLVVRPTSETIIGEMFSKWITSYRDLPLRINQWANVVRWEMRVRLFLRTTEFLWQEGHTAHATQEEAEEEAMLRLKQYVDFVENTLAIAVIAGEKSESERFPGALATFTFEAMMQDRKALQGGTSHFLGQNFAKASSIKFRAQSGAEEYVWTTSWGVSTRLIGALVMVHSDDDGLIVPPKIAPQQVVIIPILHKEETKDSILAYARKVAEMIRSDQCAVMVDEREMRGGEKSWSWIKKGVPIRLEIGAREMEKNEVSLLRRDLPHKERKSVSLDALRGQVARELEEMHQALFDRSKRHQMAHSRRIDSKEEFYAFFTPKNRENPEIHGGFALTHFSGDAAVEEKIRQELSVTIRCIPLDSAEEEGICPFTGKKSSRRVIFAKAY